MIWHGEQLAHGSEQIKLLGNKIIELSEAPKQLVTEDQLEAYAQQMVEEALF